MNFPSSPTAGSIYSIGDKSWRWNGYAWDSLIVDLEVMGNLIVDGNLTVSGGVTSSFSETVVVEDNIILLNSNVTGGSPSENAGIEVSRGASANVQLRWNESTDKWQFTNDGTQFYDMPTSVVNTINGYTGAFTLTGTANEVEITGATSFVVGLPDTVTITNLTVTNSVTASTFDGALLGRVTTLIKNDDTITLTAGMPVYISGYQGGGNSGILLVKAADSSNSSTMPAVGLVETTLAVNGQGHVVELGLLGSLNTNGFSANQVVYIAPGGGLTATRPTAGTHLVQNIGRVVNASTNQGQIIVLGPGRSNDVPNRITVRDYLEMPNGQTATSLVTSWNGASGAVTFSNYVTSVNGSTGAVTNVAKTDTAQTFTAIQSFALGFTADGATFNSNLYAGVIKGGQLNVQNTGNNLLGDVTGVLGGGYIQVDNSSSVAVNNIYGTLYTDAVRIGRASSIPALNVTGSIYTSGLINTTARVSCAGITSSGISTFTGSVTANNLYISEGVTFASTSVHTGLATFNAGVTANNLYISQGATFASNISAPNVVYSFNGNSGTVTYAPPLATSSVTGVASFGNEFVVSAAGAVSLTGNYVKSFNGLTGTVTYATPLATSSVTGVASFGNEFVVSTAGAVSLTANYVKSWNGSTGAVTFSNYVTSVNGSTGAISSIAVTGANTFTGLQTMNAGITANNLWVTNGATFAARSSFNSGLTASNLYVSAGATFAGGLNVSTITSNGTLTVNNAANSIVRIGDYDLVGNGTYIELNDIANTIGLVGVVNTGTIYGTFYGDMHPTSIIRAYSVNSQTVTTTSTTGANQTICTINNAYDGIQSPAVISPAIEATIVATDNTVANKNEILRMLITHDGTNTYNTQYGVVRTGAALATYTTTYSGAGLKNLLIRATPTSANSTSFIVTYTVYNR